MDQDNSKQSSRSASNDEFKASTTNETKPTTKNKTKLTEEIAIKTTTNNEVPLLLLDDDCLLKVFEHLELKEFCSMADVCKRLRTITATAFHVKFQQLDFFEQNQLLFRRVMRKFGHLITSLNISKSILAPNDVNAIKKYGRNLDQLSMAMVKIDCDAFKPIFARLKCLCLENFTFIGNQSQLYSVCTELRELHIDASKYFDMPKCSFPKLNSLRFDCRYTWKRQHLWELLRLNPQIGRLHILALADDEVIENVVQYAKNVEELLIAPATTCKQPNRQTRQGLVNLANLKSLKKLSLEATNNDYSESVDVLADAFSNKKMAIEYLCFESFDIARLDLDNILKLKTLRHLVLGSFEEIIDKELILITKELPLLEKLRIDIEFSDLAVITTAGLIDMISFGKRLSYLGINGVRYIDIDQNTFKALVNVRENGGFLKIAIIGCPKTTYFNVQQQVQFKNRFRLQIDYKAAGNANYRCSCYRCKPVIE